MKMFNVFLSTSQTKYGIGNLLHFVKCGDNIQILRHPDDEGGGVSVINEEGVRFYGYDLVIAPAGDFFYLTDDGKWFSHGECEIVDNIDKE